MSLFCYCANEKEFIHSTHDISRDAFHSSARFNAAGMVLSASFTITIVAQHQRRRDTRKDVLDVIHVWNPTMPVAIKAPFEIARPRRLRACGLFAVGPRVLLQLFINRVWGGPLRLSCTVNAGSGQKRDIVRTRRAGVVALLVGLERGQLASLSTVTRSEF